MRAWLHPPFRPVAMQRERKRMRWVRGASQTGEWGQRRPRPVVGKVSLGERPVWENRREGQCPTPRLRRNMDACTVFWSECSVVLSSSLLRCATAILRNIMRIMMSVCRMAHLTKVCRHLTMTSKTMIKWLTRPLQRILPLKRRRPNGWRGPGMPKQNMGEST